MKKKIIAIVILVVFVLINYTTIVNAEFIRSGGTKLKNVATIINENTYIDRKYSAQSNRVTYANVNVYEYDSENPITLSESNLRPIDRVIYYKIPMTSTSGTLENVATIKYSDAITYEGKNYDVKVDIEKIIAENTSSEVLVLIGFREDESEENKYNLNLYTLGFIPAIAADSNYTHLEIKVKYRILDKDGSPVSLNGVFGLTDVDGAQGIAVDNFTINGNEENKNIFMSRDGENYDVNDPNDRENVLKYKTYNNGIYVYSDLEGPDQGTPGVDNVYLLMDNKNAIDITFTFDQMATSEMVFLKNAINTHKKITTKVTGGTISATEENINIGEDRTITYSPNDSSRQYLKSVTIDGEQVDVTQYSGGCTFLNITEDHTIEVVYENKYKVEFDAKGGNPTPDTQYVLPAGKATEPTTNPTKIGYTFEGWKKTNDTDTYNFDTPVNSDIELEAVWTTDNYRINYVLNGGTNDSRNPNTYKVTDTIDFQPATKEGYVFKGWYEDEGFVSPIAGISNRVGDVTVYAKWEARGDVTYKVEHYKKNENGNYEKVTTDELTGTTGETVTAVAKDYAGFRENTTHGERVQSGTVKADGSLVLKLYYDPIIYHINYVLNGGTNDSRNPSTYKVTDTVNFQPATKTGYNFISWNRNENLTDPIAGFTGGTEDITVYAKWEAKNGVAYKVEHYQKNENGNYEKITTDELTGTVGERVTAVAKNYVGFKENTSHTERVESGTVKADGSLVLKLYYDPDIYNINYVLNGGTNDSRNPKTYKVTDTVNFQPATRPGYDFVSWYEDEKLTKPIAGFTGGTEDITVYAKWEAQKNIEYKVEHYKETKNGEYELVVTDTLVGEVEKEVRAEAKEYPGFKENITYSGRIPTGKIKLYGSLVLKLYYDKIKYTVTFDPQNDSKIPEQIVPHQEKATEPNKPTKEDYEFKYWYYINKEEQEVKYNFDDPVTTDLHLIAKWTKVEKVVENTKAPTPQKDTTSAPTPIPQTGDFNPVMVFSIIAIVTLAGTFGIKYFNLKIK